MISKGGKRKGGERDFLNQYHQSYERLMWKVTNIVHCMKSCGTLAAVY